MSQSIKFWLYVAKFYLSLRRGFLLCKSLFLRGAKSAIFYGLIIVITVQAIFFILTIEKTNKLQATLAAYHNDTSMMLNRIYSQVFLLNARVNQVLEQKK